MATPNLRLASFINLPAPAKILMLIFSVVFVAISAYFDTHAEQIQTYTVADGLVGPVVPVIFQDSRGNLWFGSDQNGVSRFDGNTFEPYYGSLNPSELLSAKVGPGALLGQTLQIVEDKWGYIWFLTRVPSERIGRVSRFDGNSISLIGNGNSLIADHLGNIWVGGKQRLTKYVADTQHPPQAQPNEIIGEDLLGSTYLTINVIFESKDGTLWLGGSVGENQQIGVILSFRESHQGNETLSRETTNKTDDSTPHTQARSGFVRYDAENFRVVKTTVASDGQKVVRYQPSNFHTPGGITAIAEDNSGNLWFGGYNLLLRFDRKNFEQILPATSRYKSSASSTPQETTINRKRNRKRARRRSISALHETAMNRKTPTIQSDSQGRVWFSDEYTTRWWDGSRLRTHENLSGFLEAEDAWGNLWFTNEKGPQQYNADLEPISYTASSGLENDHIHTIFEAVDGKLWFGHNNGVMAFDPIPAISTHAGLGNHRVRLIYEDSRGYLWFSVRGGVARYNAELGELTTASLLLGLTQDGSPSAQVNATDRDQTRLRFRTEVTKIFEVDGHIWFVNSVDPRRSQRSTRYTFFRYANGKFDEVTISIKTRIGPGGEGANIEPEVLLTEGKHRWLAFGGHLFKADTSGLLHFTNSRLGKLQQILFETTTEIDQYVSAIKSFQFGTTTEIDQAETPITDLYKDLNDRLWVHFGNGKVLRYPKNLERLTARTRPIVPEILPLKATTLLKSTTAGKWYFNAVTGKLIMWSETELYVPHTLEGGSSSAPLAVWKDPTQQNNEITFLFSNALRTYLGTKLITTRDIELASVNASLTSKDGSLWLATSRGAVRYDGKELTTYTTKDGFLVNNVSDVIEDSSGNIWFATRGGGIVQYDGETFHTRTTKNG